MGDKAQADWRLVVEQIARGDRAGEEILYKELNSGARLFLQRRLGTPDVQDHVHDVFLVVIQTIRGGELREPERLMGFVRTVLYRQLSLAISRIAGARKTVDATDSASQLNDLEPDPEQRVLDQEKIATMKRGMKKMKKEDVEILDRFYMRGQSPARICEEMGLTMTQFALKKSRAKATLTTLMQRAAASRRSDN